MDITKELEDVQEQIKEISTDFVDSRGKAQISNLIDKIENRQKMPNFVSTIKVTGVKEPVKVEYLTFLKGIITEAEGITPEEIKTLKKLEKRQVALKVLIEMSKDGEKSEE